MRSNEHSGDRGGQWNTDGLQGAALTIVEGDKDAGRFDSLSRIAKSDDFPILLPIRPFSLCRQQSS